MIKEIALIIEPTALGHSLRDNLSARFYEDGFSFTSCSDSKEEIITAVNNKPSVIIIGPNVQNPISSARYAYNAFPSAHLIFIPSEQRLPLLQRELSLAPMIGTNWNIASTNDKSFKLLLTDSAKSARQRKQFRTQISHLNKRLELRTPADIHEIKKLIISDRYLATILTHAQDAIFSTDMQGQLISWNHATELMLGYSESEIRQNSSTFLQQNRYLNVIKDLIKRVKTDEHVRSKMEVLHKDGTILNIDLTLTMIRDELGQPFGISVIARDITQHNKLLEETEQQKRIYETALSNTADFNYVFNLEGRFIYINKAMLDLWQKSLEEAIGKNFFELNYPFKLAEKLQNQIQHVIATKETVKDETPYSSANGKRSYEYIFKPVIGEDGAVEAVAGSSRDITDYLETNRRKDEFLAMLAHELRNPLAPISNAMHIMKSLAATTKIREEAFLLVDRQINQMTRLLDDLLDVSRVTLGKIELRADKVALSEIITTAVESIQPLISKRNQTLNINTLDKAIWLNADKIRLSQVFSNLLNNSAKYTQEGGHIEIHISEDNSGLTVTISDNGIGIPKEVQPRIFELFSQVDSSMERSHGGLGIGLTLVKSLVEMHKGSVTVKSEGLEKGSIFTVRLPAEIRIKDQQISTASQKDTENKIRPYRVLVVDDNEASAQTLAWTLEILGHQTKLAHEGYEAIEAAKTYLPDVILLDIGLPKLNGYEVCEALRKEAELKDTIIIAQTGWGQKEHLQRSKEAGFDHHLVKPVKMETLEKILATFRA